MNFTSANFGNFTRIESFPSSHRQARFLGLGPLLGFFLASLFPNLAIARLQQGSIKFQYDPIPTIPRNPLPSISIYQTPEPTWVPVTEPPENFHLEPTGEAHHHPVTYPDILSTNLESPSEYLIPKVSVKRSISSRYLSAYRRNRYGIRRRYPEYLDYDNYDYATTPRLRNRLRNQGRRPIGLDYDYDYDYDYGKGQRRKQQRRRIKNKDRKGSDYDDDEEFDDDVESVKPRQQLTTTTRATTTTEATTMPMTTTITNGSTPSTTTSTNASATTGYGYGPYSGNENISITYGPPSAIKPVYGVPGAAYGAPLSEWAPSYVYESPSSYHSHRYTSYYRPSSYQSPSVSYASPSSYGIAGSGSSSYSPSTSYGTPGSTYGAPSVGYSKPYATYSHSASYGPPSTSYGVPNQSYGVPSSSANQPQASPGGRATNYQSYQLPFSSWYGRSASHSDIVKRVQDIIKYD